VATETLRPDSDVTKEWYTSAGTDHYLLVDNGVGTPVDTDYIGAGTDGKVDRFTLTAPSFSGICTSIRVQVRGARYTSGDSLDIGIYDAGGQIGSNKTITNAVLSIDNVWTTAWSGLSKSNADIGGLEVQLTGNIGPSGDYIVYEIDVEITYSSGPSDISEVNDVAGGSVGEINDVSWSSVSEVNDVS